MMDSSTRVSLFHECCGHGHIKQKCQGVLDLLCWKADAQKGFDLHDQWIADRVVSFVGHLAHIVCDVALRQSEELLPEYGENISVHEGRCNCSSF